VVNPDDIIDDIGADSFRMYEMYMGAFDQAIPWSTDGARGCKRFLDRVWRLQEMLVDSNEVTDDMAFDVHSCIKKVSEDFERMKFNTAIAAMMSLVNAFYAKGSITKGELSILIRLLNPVAPHITEELNAINGCVEGELIRAEWPVCDESKLVQSTVEIAMQINGKMRGKLNVPADLTRDSANDYFLALPEIQPLIAGKSVKKLVFVPGRLVNVVVG